MLEMPLRATLTSTLLITVPVIFSLIILTICPCRPEVQTDVMFCMLLMITSDGVVRVPVSVLLAFRKNRENQAAASQIQQREERRQLEIQDAFQKRKKRNRENQILIEDLA